MSTEEAIKAIEEILERVEKLEEHDAIVFYFYSRLNEIKDNAQAMLDLILEIEEKERS